MSATICPTLTVSDPHDYRNYMEQLAEFAPRVHIDLADGSLAPTKLLPLDYIWWPATIRADLHAMYERPFDYLDAYVALGPQLVIVHAEAEGNFIAFAEALHSHGIETGIALLQATPVSAIEEAIDYIDHVLVFSGNLGHYGGQADLKLAGKVAELRVLKPTLEISWDGGINDQNAADLARSGVDVLNVGSFMSNSPSPYDAYAKLEQEVGRIQ